MTDIELLQLIIEKLDGSLRTDRLWSIDDVMRYTGVSRNTAYELMSSTKAPRPIEIVGERTRRWIPDEVMSFCKTLRA